MESKTVIPKKCLSWKDTAINACNAMEEPTICRDIADALFVQCVNHEKQKEERRQDYNHKK